MHLDHAGDVAPVAVAEVLEDLVVDGVELAAERVEFLRAQPCERAFSHARHRGLQSVHSAISTSPSGALMQVRTISPRCPDTLPVRRSRTWPEHRRPTQVWQIPILQPYGNV